MELKCYWRLVMTNDQEYFIKSEIEDTDSFLKLLSNRGLLTKDVDYIKLQLGDSDPLNIKADKLFSVQKARDGIIGSQTKLWRLL